MSCIKSVQRGTGSGNATITIAAVDINKSLILVTGGRTITDNSYNSQLNGAIPYGYFGSTTTLIVANAIMNYGAKPSTQNVPYSWQVIEFA